MKSTAVISVHNPKGIFTAPYEENVYRDVVVLSVKNNSRAMKKLIKNLNYENAVIACGFENENIFINKKKIFKDYSLLSVLPVVGELCRKTAQKFGLKIPFAEIYIEASPTVACGLLMGIQSLSKIFTIVSEEPPLTNAYDELYFKHGTVIRHIPGYCNNITREAVIIRCDTTYSEFSFDIPVINFSSQREEKKLTVNAFEVYVNDGKFNDFLRHWGGQCGIFLYGLLGAIPAQNAEIDINKKANEIFLLDTDTK